MPVIKSRLYLALALALPAIVTAAAEVDDAIAACARISSTGDRILCLEDALRRLSPPDAPTALLEADEEEPVADEAASLTAGGGEEQPDSMPERVDASDSTALAADAAVSRSVPEVVADAAESAPQIELGAEQVARQNNVEEEQVRIKAAIVEHALVGTGRLRLTLDNGQVWQQTGDDDDRIARRIRGQENIAVEMWQSRSGGYRMHLLEADRIMRVRRIR